MYLNKRKRNQSCKNKIILEKGGEECTKRKVNQRVKEERVRDFRFSTFCFYCYGIFEIVIHRVIITYEATKFIFCLFFVLSVLALFFIFNSYISFVLFVSMFCFFALFSPLFISLPYLSPLCLRLG